MVSDGDMRRDGDPGCETRAHDDDRTPAAPVTGPKLPALPVHVLPDWVQQFALEVACETQTPIDLVAMMILAVVATAAAARFEVAVRGTYREGVNLYVVVGMDPGTRKTSVVQHVLRPLRELEAHLCSSTRQARAGQRAVREALQARLTKTKNLFARGDASAAEVERASEELEHHEVDAEPRFFVDDATVEATTTLLAAHGRISIMTSEAGPFEAFRGRYSKGGNAPIDTYLKGYSNEALRVDRQGREAQRVDNPAVTIGAAVQPVVLEDVRGDGWLVGRGLLDRFLYAVPESPIGKRDMHPPTMGGAVRDAYHRTVYELASRLYDAEAQTLVLSADALDSWQRFITDLEAQRGAGRRLSGAVRGWACKLDGQIIRIAALLHVLEHAPRMPSAEISSVAMDGAIEIGTYLIEHARAVFEGAPGREAARLAADIVGWIDAEQLASFAQRDAQRRFSGKTADDVRSALEVLAARGVVCRRPTKSGPRGGRRPIIWEVCPPGSVDDADDA